MEKLRRAIQTALILAAIVVAMGQGCKDDSSNESGNGDFYGGFEPTEKVLTKSVEAMVNSLTGAMDDVESDDPQADGVKNGEPAPDAASSIIGGSTDPGQCSPAAEKSPCIDGIKQATYMDCRIPLTNTRLTGSVTLTYSDSLCSMEPSGASILRQIALVFTTGKEDKLTSSYLPKTDYRGVIMGGGTKVTSPSDVDPVWTFDLRGKHTTYILADGQPLLDVSQRTPVPFRFGATIVRSVDNMAPGREVSEGSMEVNHNLGRFTALYEADHIKWTKACCHPVEGSLSVTYSGAFEAEAIVRFTGAENLVCGTAELEFADKIIEFQMKHCE